MLNDVAVETLTLLNATTDWLDGLNKKLNIWDLWVCVGEFRSICIKVKMDELRWPSVDMLSRSLNLTPIPHILVSYAKFHKLLTVSGKSEETLPNS